MDDYYSYIFLAFRNEMDGVGFTNMNDRIIYDYLNIRGLCLTAEVFRRQVGVPIIMRTPLSPIAEEEGYGENSVEWMVIINDAGEVQWEAFVNEAGSSYIDEESMWQQSDLTPYPHPESNEQMVEEATLGDIFGTDNQGLEAVVEACQSSKPVPNECCVEVKENDAQDVVITNDRVELSSLVKGKKSEEGGSCSQDAYLYDSSSFNLGNEDDNAIGAFSFNESHEAPNNDEIQGVTVGGNAVLQTAPHPERVMLPSIPANAEDTVTLGPHSVAQAVPITPENASNEHGDGGIYVPGGNNSDSETWFPVPVYLKNFPKHSSFCPQNEEDVKAASYSQDAYMHYSSLNGKENEDNTMLSLRNLYEHHESSKNDDLKGVTVGGEFVPEIMTNTENPIMCSPALNLDVTGNGGLDSVVQGILRSGETSESGRKRKWFEVSGGGEGDSPTRNAHLSGSSCGKRNEDDGVSPRSGSHQNNAYPN